MKEWVKARESLFILKVNSLNLVLDHARFWKFEGSTESQPCDEDIAHVHSPSGITCNFLHHKTMECALLQYPRVNWVPRLKITLERPRK